MVPTTPILAEHEIAWDVEEEHLREAEFLFEVREAVLDTPHYDLAELEAGPEQRLLAHVDALVIGGPLVADRLLFATIDDEDEIEDYEAIAAASMAVLAQPHTDRHERLFAILAQGHDTQLHGVSRALQLTDSTWLESRLRRATADAAALSAPRFLTTCLTALAARGADLAEGLHPFLRSTDPAVARAAATLARFNRDRTSLELLGPLAQAADPQLRRTTIETALYRLMPGAWESAVYWAFMAGESDFRRDALVWVACLGDPRVHERLLAYADDPVHQSDALWAMGFTGRVAAVERCIPLLANENIGPLAAEVVCAITGLASDAEGLWHPPSSDPEPEQTLPELADDDLDADLVPKAEASLPVPAPDEIAAWWQENRSNFDPGLRYIAGRPFDRDALVDGLWNAPMRRRHVLAFELGVRSGGAFVDTRAMCATQKLQLGALDNVGRIDCQQGLSAR